MARPRKKIPRTTALQAPFALNSSGWERIERVAGQSFSQQKRDELVKSDWERIERAYGQSFSQQQRDEVIKITKDFLYWASAEQAPSLKKAQDRASALRKHTASLLKEIRRQSPVAPYTNELIADCFREFWRQKTWRVPSGHYRVQRGKGRRVASPIHVRSSDALPLEVTEVLSSFLSACDEALNQMKSQSSETWMWKDREPWNRWALLTDFADKNAFPTVSSISRREKASPFVRFVQQLQVSIPKKYRRSNQSLVALKQAIGDQARARTYTAEHNRQKSKALNVPPRQACFDPLSRRCPIFPGAAPRATK
jgi:hypothetical protein